MYFWEINLYKDSRGQVILSIIGGEVMNNQSISKSKSIVINKNMLINELVLNMDNEIDKEDVIALFNHLEENIINHLQKANKNKTVTVKLFNGISLIAEHKDALVKNGITYKPERICYKARVTTYLKRKLNGK